VLTKMQLVARRSEGKAVLTGGRQALFLFRRPSSIRQSRGGKGSQVAKRRRKRAHKQTAGKKNPASRNVQRKHKEEAAASVKGG